MLFIIQQVFIEYLPCAEKSWGRGIGRAVNKRDEGIVLLEFIFWYEKKKYTGKTNMLTCQSESVQKQLPSQHLGEEHCFKGKETKLKQTVPHLPSSFSLPQNSYVEE